MSKKQITSVVIAGAAGTLGQKLVSYFAAKKLKVIAVVRNEKESESLLKVVQQNSIQDFCTISAIDLAAVDSVQELTKQISQLTQQVDVVVNAAGAFIWKPLDETNATDYDLMLDSNLKTSWVLLRALLPMMKKNSFGRMVFVSAKGTQSQAAAGLGLYLAAKAGINMLVQTAAEEVKDFDISINAVLPSIIDNPQNRVDMPDVDFSKWVSPENLSELIGSLCESSFGQSVNGSLITVAGRV